MAESRMELSSPAARSRRLSILVGSAENRSNPSASRKRLAGSTVIKAVFNPSRAAASPSAAATVVLPTPPVPSIMSIEPFLSSSFTNAAASHSIRKSNHGMQNTIAAEANHLLTNSRRGCGLLIAAE